MKLKTLGKQQKSLRGFKYIQFEDIYKNKCFLQESSIWLDDNLPGKSALWIGMDKSWMLLNKKQIKGLIMHLSNWLEKGNF